MRQALAIVFASLTICTVASSCQDDYLEDTGTHRAEYPGTIYDYLRTFPDSTYFRDLVDIIDYAGLRSTLEDSTVTFFAPTDRSIRGSVNFLSQRLYRNMGRDSIRSLRQIRPEVWRRFLSEYIIRDRYTLRDIPQIDTTKVEAYPGQGYYSLGGTPMNIGVVYYSAAGVEYAGARQIIYSYVVNPQEHEYLNAYVATCDIQPRNGVLHVLRWTDHSFAFTRQRFAAAAINEGILP